MPADPAGVARAPAGSVLLVALAACSWGTWSLFVRPTGLPPATTAAIVFFLLALGSVPLLRLDPRPRWDGKVVALLAAFTVLDAVNVGTFFGAMQATTVAVAVLTHSLAPLLVALLAPAVDGQRVRGAPAAALAALTGVGLLLRPWEGIDQGVLEGALLGATSALAYAANVFLVRRLVPRIGAVRANAIHAVGAGLLLLPAAAPGLAAVEGRDLGLLAAGTALCALFGSIAFGRGLVRIGSARAAVLAFLEPLVACVVGWLAFGEHLSLLSLGGGALILAAGLGVARAEARAG